MSEPWTFDEFKQIGVDFADPEQVANYDARQQVSRERAAQLVRRLGIAAGNVVVEFGPGTGIFARAAARVRATVTAVDISTAMLAHAQERARQENLDSIEFVNSGFLAYDRPAASADIVVTEFALHHLPDFWKGVALSNISRWLKPGGIFYLRDIVYSFTPEQHSAALNDWIESVVGEPGSSFARSDFELHIRAEYSTFGWIMEGLLERAGLTIVEKEYAAPAYAEYVCHKGRL